LKAKNRNPGKREERAKRKRRNRRVKGGDECKRGMGRKDWVERIG